MSYVVRAITSQGWKPILAEDPRTTPRRSLLWGWFFSTHGGIQFITRTDAVHALLLCEEASVEDPSDVRFQVEEYGAR